MSNPGVTNPSSTETDEAIDVALARLWAVRTILDDRWLGNSLAVSLQAVDNTNVAELDHALSARSNSSYESVTFEGALAYARLGGAGSNSLLEQEFKVVPYLPRNRVIAIHVRAVKKLRQLSRKRGMVAVSRSGDLTRKWSELSNYLWNTVKNPGKPNVTYRIDQAIYQIDGLIILLSNAKTNVGIPTFRLSVSIAAGVLR